MGFCNIASQIVTYASIHVIHVWWRGADIQYGNRIHASPDPIQEYRRYQYRYVHLMQAPLSPALFFLTPHVTSRRSAFAPFAPTTASPSSAKSITTLPLQKVVYILCNLLTLAVGLWKCRSMGLLPTGTGDWLAFESRGLVSRFIICIQAQIDLFLGS